MATIIQRPTKTTLPIISNGAKSKYRNEAARQLLREWREDTSGYDEETWPKVKQIIEENRLSVRSKLSD